MLGRGSVMWRWSVIVLGIKSLSRRTERRSLKVGSEL